MTIEGKREHAPKVVREGTQLHTVLQALSEIPGVPMTSIEIADETGLSIKHCSSYVYRLRKMGLAKSAQTYRAGVHASMHQHWVGDLL